MKGIVSRIIQPILVAVEGKGMGGMLARARSIAWRYGLTSARMECSLSLLRVFLQRFECQATLAVTVSALKRNRAVIQDFSEFEFALHGYRHIDHLGMSGQEQIDHVSKASQVAKEIGLAADGYRCPYLRWNQGTLKAVAGAGLLYDSSGSLACPVDGKHATPEYSRVLDFYGAPSLADEPALPLLDEELGLIRIPYCLPDDEALVERMHWDSPDEMKDVWPSMFDQIHELGELFTLGLHPERVFACSDALTGTLENVRAESSVWCAPLNAIARWWKDRYAAAVSFDQLEPDLFQVTVKGPSGTELLGRSLEVRTKAKRWSKDYWQASEFPCVIRANLRPVIGIDHDSPLEMISFLRQQGYVVEPSFNRQDYFLYLDRHTLLNADRRSILREIEGSPAPLIRFGRWPNGAQSVFAVTGDIDGFTVWDYLLRIAGK